MAGRRPMESYPWYFNMGRVRHVAGGTEESAFSPPGATRLHGRKKFAKLFMK